MKCVSATVKTYFGQSKWLLAILISSEKMSFPGTKLLLVLVNFQV